ncbi:hypothetical protein DS745_11645 [Anaerobacillus alkaliphilus]|uniref:Uncharacterized protein n=1 Tax=Anaerobacillus alkaliphilus TaxID=1548597 RepID=A0A4Q0VU58_9BACI|nr:hypothetical protein [Anaerobacillus alkaliphilus]RXJ00704.1 hypothetical protein DS745_11645 [Anaerobacillus alkaliphilus]
MKQKYYVTLNPQELGIGQIRDDSQLVQYEIEVNEAELAEVQNYLKHYSEELYDPQNVILHPFSFEDVDNDNKQSLNNLERIYQIVYRYGTEKTKRDLESIYQQNNQK